MNKINYDLTTRLQHNGNMLEVHYPGWRKRRNQNDINKGFEWFSTNKQHYNDQNLTPQILSSFADIINENQPAKERFLFEWIRT